MERALNAFLKNLWNSSFPQTPMSHKISISVLQKQRFCSQVGFGKGECQNCQFRDSKTLDVNTQINLGGQTACFTWFNLTLSNSFYHQTDLSPLPRTSHSFLTLSSLLPFFLLLMIFSGYPLTSKTIHNCKPSQPLNEESDIITLASGIQQERGTRGRDAI